LSARITNTQYFSETISSSAQTISDSRPSASVGETWPPASATTVCMVYSGLVPRSP
jgi:hypothetical protein